MHLTYDDLRKALSKAPHGQWAAERKCLMDEELSSCREKVKTLTNDQLFEDYSELLAGDDWEGEFTYGGQMAMRALNEELTHRLVLAGFLTAEHWSIHA